MSSSSQCLFLPPPQLFLPCLVIHLLSLSLRAKPAGRWLDLIIQPLQWADCEDIINGTEEGDAVQECSTYNGPDYSSSAENPKYDPSGILSPPW